MNRVETSDTRTDSPGVSLLIGVQSGIVMESWTRRGAEAARQAHNLEVVGSNPAAATELKRERCNAFLFLLVKYPELHLEVRAHWYKVTSITFPMLPSYFFLTSPKMLTFQLCCLAIY